MKQFLHVLCLLSLSYISHAQIDIDNSQPFPFQERVYFVVSPVLSLSNFVSTIGITPDVGVMVNNRVSLGLGGTYLYYKERNFNGVSWYGARAFGRVNVTEKYFAYVEHESLSVPISIIDQRGNVRRTFVGIGSFNESGRNVSYQFIVLYDLSSVNPDFLSNLSFRAGIVITPFN